MVAALILALCLNYSILGAVEAILWSKKAADAFKWNEHVLLGVQRLMVIGAIILASTMSLKEVLYAIGISLPMWWFFHDGAIYLTRNLIDKNVYVKRWFDVSTTSTAKLPTAGKWFRIGTFLFGVVLLGLYYVKYI